MIPSYIFFLILLDYFCVSVRPAVCYLLKSCLPLKQKIHCKTRIKHNCTTAICLFFTQLNTKDMKRGRVTKEMLLFCSSFSWNTPSSNNDSSPYYRHCYPVFLWHKNCLLISSKVPQLCCRICWCSWTVSEQPSSIYFEDFSYPRIPLYFDIFCFIALTTDMESVFICKTKSKISYKTPGYPYKNNFIWKTEINYGGLKKDLGVGGCEPWLSITVFLK